MSLLKNILGAFVEFEDNDKKEPQPKATVPADKPVDIIASQPIPAAPVAVPAPEYSSSATNIDNTSLDAYNKHFTQIIEEANEKNPIFSGTDFKEFMDSKADVEAITDEATRYKTAFNVLKRTGLTKEKLVSTGMEYINVIDKDIKAFETAFNQKYNADVVQKEQLLQQKAQELQSLNEKISTINQQIKQIGDEVNLSKEKLNSSKNSFLQAGELKKNEIKTELQKINQFFS